MPKKTSPISQALRKAAIGSGLSVYALAKASGVPQPSLHKFVHLNRDMRLSNADKLARFLKLSLKPL